MKNRPYWEFFVHGPPDTVYKDKVVKVCVGFDMNYPFKAPELFMPDVPESKEYLFHLACGYQEFVESGEKGTLCTFCPDVIKKGWAAIGAPSRRPKYMHMLFIKLCSLLAKNTTFTARQ